jgi:hypothetical protein
MNPGQVLDGTVLEVRNLPRCQSKLGISTSNVPASRLLNTTAPLTGGGDLSADRTFAIPAASATVDGYLTAAAFVAFSSKENALAFTPPITRVGDTIGWTGTTTDVPEGANLYWTQARFDTAFGAKSTTNLVEGTNLYYTDARARAAFSGTAPIAVSAGGVVSISVATASAAGSQSAADFVAARNVVAMLRGGIYLS